MILTRIHPNYPNPPEDIVDTNKEVEMVQEYIIANNNQTVGSDKAHGNDSNTVLAWGDDWPWSGERMAWNLLDVLFIDNLDGISS